MGLRLPSDGFKTFLRIMFYRKFPREALGLFFCTPVICESTALTKGAKEKVNACLFL